MFHKIYAYSRSEYEVFIVHVLQLIVSKDNKVQNRGSRIPSDHYFGGPKVYETYHG